MKTYAYTTTTTVPAEKLYRAITDISSWPRWDPDIEATVHDGKLHPGAFFTLKPKGGPKVKIEIVEATAPHSFVDLSYLPLGKMRTSHSFRTVDGHTEVTVRIDVWGPLGFLWDKVIAKKQAAGAANQTGNFLAYAGSIT